MSLVLAELAHPSGLRGGWRRGFRLSVRLLILFLPTRRVRARGTCYLGADQGIPGHELFLVVPRECPSHFSLLVEWGVGPGTLFYVGPSLRPHTPRLPFRLAGGSRCVHDVHDLRRAPRGRDLLAQLGRSLAVRRLEALPQERVGAARVRGGRRGGGAVHMCTYSGNRGKARGQDNGSARAWASCAAWRRGASGWAGRCKAHDSDTAHVPPLPPSLCRPWHNGTKTACCCVHAGVKVRRGLQKVGGGRG